MAIPSGTQAIGRTFEVLRLIARRGVAGMPLTDLSAATGLPHPTVHRFLKALVAEGAVLQDKVTKRYALGPAPFRLSLASRYSSRLLAERFRPALNRLAEATQDTIYLVLRSGFDAICVDRVEATTAIRIVTWEIGAWRPLGIGAAGTALLASLPEQEMDDCLRYNAEEYRRFSDLTAEDVRRRADAARREGFAYTNYSLPIGTRAIGAALHVPDGVPLIGFSIGAVEERITQRMELLKEALNEEISRFSEAPAEELWA